MNSLIKGRRAIFVLAIVAALAVGASYAFAEEEDPFAGGADALAVSGSDGSSSVRAKLKLRKMTADMIMVRVEKVDDSKFPNCLLYGKVLKAAKNKTKQFKLIGRGKTYRFKPQLKQRRGKLNLKDKMTQNNLGACYYPKKTKLIIKVGGVDKPAKAFVASEIYLK